MKRAVWFASLCGLLYVLISTGQFVPNLGLLEESPDALVAAAMRMIAAGIAAHLLTLLVLDALSNLAPSRCLTAVTARLAPVAVRKMLGATLAMSSVAAVSSSPATAATGYIVGLPAELREPPVMHEVGSSVDTTTSTTAVPSPAINAATPPDESVTNHPTEWTVQPGQSFWSIAEVLAPGDVDPTWRALIEANRDRLVDPDNADLLIPGQTLAVPVSSGS